MPIAAIFPGATEANDASNRRRRPAEEEDHPRDRPGTDAALGRRIDRAGCAAEGGDRPARSEHGNQAGVQIRSRPVLQEVMGGARIYRALTINDERAILNPWLSFLVHY